MYTIIKSVISAGGYKLADVQHKIKKMHMLGDLTEAQMDELLLLAARSAAPDGERPETIAMLQTLLGKIEALEDRVAKLEDLKEDTSEEDPDDSGESGDPDTNPEGGDEPGVPETVVYPEWEPWNGIDDRYQPGSIVTRSGKIWISVFKGQNVWEPGVVTDGFWEEYIPEDA